MLAGRRDGLMLGDRQGNGETRRLAAERGVDQHCQKTCATRAITANRQLELSRHTCASNMSTVRALNPGAQDSKSPHLLLLRKKGKKREENFPSDFRLPVWAGAEVARNRTKQMEPTQRSGFGACHKCWGNCRLPAVPHPCREQHTLPGNRWSPLLY